MRKKPATALLLAVTAPFFLSGCAGMVKTRTHVQVPPGYAQARVASLNELVELINGRYAGVQTLSVSQLEVEFQGGSVEEGYLEQYPRGKGYLVVRGPDSVYVNILNPLTSSTVSTMASTGETFQIWVPSENKYFTGKTSVELDDRNPFLNVRPHHILPALLVEKVPSEGGDSRYFLEETQDGRLKYYLLGVVVLEKDSSVVRLARKLWIERSQLRLVRQEYFGSSGEILTDIRYNRPVEVAGFLINAGIEILRVRERYSIRFHLEPGEIKVNQPLREGIFDILRPPGAEVVVVKGKNN